MIAVSAPTNERLWDDSAFTPLGQTPPEPQTLGTLLAQLGAGRAQDAESREAVRGWLGSHTPSERLRRSMTRRGYGDLLDERRSKLTA